MTAAYPLQWPDGWKRTSPGGLEDARFKCTFAQARDGIIKQLGMMGVARSIVISTNVETKRDGLPYANRPQPSDRGVAVYWTKFTIGGGSEQRVLACDRWYRVRDNLRAIEKTLEAMRGIERWGSTDIMDRAFSGFTALPESASGWRGVLEFSAGYQPTLAEILDRAKKLILASHPDVSNMGEREANQKTADILEARHDAIQDMGYKR